MEAVFTRAKEHRIYLNPRKVIFVESSVPFGGFIVDAEGFRGKKDMKGISFFVCQFMNVNFI